MLDNDNIVTQKFIYTLLKEVKKWNKQGNSKWNPILGSFDEKMCLDGSHGNIYIKIRFSFFVFRYGARDMCFRAINILENDLKYYCE